jgi:transcriptional regulator with XRE-family HTH domain
MSPFSALLHRLRLRHQVRQSELAEMLGYEQSYISALEIGLKGPPTAEFVEKLIHALALSPLEQQELLEAVSGSQRKLILDADTPEDIYWLFNKLREQMNELHPVQIQLIRHALEIRDSLAMREQEHLRRLPRRKREDATM